MTADELRRLVTASPDDDLLRRCLRDDATPFVFESDRTAWDAFCGELGDDIGVRADDIRVVGSARFGFSLKPGNNLRAYSEKSDIDVVVVSPTLFDELWLGVLRAAYPRPPLDQRPGGWLRERQKEVYTGWITPLSIRLDQRIYGDRAKPVLQLSARWFTAFKKVSRLAKKRHEDIKGRLYRTWEHADLYHLHSIASLRKALTE